MKKNELIKSKTLDKFAGFVGLGAGAATVTAVGTTVGSASLLGTIGSAVGLTVAATTPIGWVLGGAALGGAALYSASKVISKKGYSEGDIEASRQFESDIEKQMFNDIRVKLSKKMSLVALDLVEKLPNDLDFKIEAKDGLEKGTMNADEVIQVCCEFLDENYDNYKNVKLTTVENIESFIKISTLLAVIDEDYSEDEKNLIREKVIEYFSLEKVLSETEISLVFKTAIGSDEKIIEISELNFFSQMNLLHTFILVEEDNEMLIELYDFLKELALIDNNKCAVEEELITFYEEFLLSKKLLLEGTYDESVLKLRSSNDLFYPSEEDETKNKKYNKKLENLIGSKKEYGYCLMANHVIAIDDKTTFGSGTDGFLFTSLGIFTNFSEAHFIPYYNLENHLEEIKEIIDYEIEDYASEFFEQIIEINKKKSSGIIGLSDEKEWHISFFQNQLGIKSMQEINDLFESKEIEISDSCMVWKDGMANWEKIEEVEELSMFVTKFKEVTPPSLPSTPPPLPSTPPPLN